MRFMSMIQKFTGAVALAGVIAMSSFSAHAATPEETITLFTDAILEAMDDEADSSMLDRYEIMYDGVGETFDLKVLARATINRVYWKTWSGEQQADYAEMLHRYQSAVLADRFEPGSDISFTIDNTIDAPRGTKIVETSIIRDDDDDIGLDYRLVKRSDRWRIIDIYLDSKISEVAMRRSEYSAVVRDEGYDALMTALEDQIIDVLGSDYEELYGEDDEDFDEEEDLEEYEDT